MDLSYLAASIVVTALVTYLLRVLPLVVFRSEIINPWVRSFPYYVPFAVLTAMTIPSVIVATSRWESGVVGLLVAIGLSYLGRSLMTVALGAAAAVWLVEVVAPLL